MPQKRAEVNTGLTGDASELTMKRPRRRLSQPRRVTRVEVEPRHIVLALLQSFCHVAPPILPKPMNRSCILISARERRGRQRNSLGLCGPGLRTWLASTLTIFHTPLASRT